jgi:hypothetical protein
MSEAPRDDATGLGALAALARIPGGLAGALADIQAIAEGMQALPQIARILAAIEKRVESLDDEVIKMRQAVDRIDGEIDTLTERVVDLQRSLRPLRRVADRVGRRGRNVPEDEVNS